MSKPKVLDDVVHGKLYIHIFENDNQPIRYKEILDKNLEYKSIDNIRRKISNLRKLGLIDSKQKSIGRAKGRRSTIWINYEGIIPIVKRILSFKRKRIEGNKKYILDAFKNYLLKYVQARHDWEEEGEFEHISINRMIEYFLFGMGRAIEIGLSEAYTQNNPAEAKMENLFRQNPFRQACHLYYLSKMYTHTKHYLLPAFWNYYEK